MKLTELEPRWWSTWHSLVPEFTGGERHGIGITFLCPHCKVTRLGVPFANPIDGKSRAIEGGGKDKNSFWQRLGDTFENLTITPSIDASECGHWHGFITNGEIR